MTAPKPILPPCVCGDPKCGIPYGKCHCGCNEPVNIYKGKLYRFKYGHSPKGRYIRTRMLWDGSNWNDGYLNNRGRFLVYRPDFPEAYESGYALRYRVVWWLSNGLPPKGQNVHHINHIKTDDRLENLTLMEHGAHTRYHCEKKLTLICDQCKKEFKICQWRIDQRLKEKSHVRFCSQTCSFLHRKLNKRSIEHRKNISEGLRKAYRDGRRGKHGR